MSHTRMSTLLVFVFHLCPLIHIDSLSWFLEHKSTTVRNILMVCGRIIELRVRVGLPQTNSSPPAILLLAAPRRLFCFGSLVILDVVCRYLLLFLLYINIKIGQNRCQLLD